MFTKVNYIFNLIVKGISETAIVSISGILFIFIFLDIDSLIITNNIILLSLANFLCAYVLDFFIFKGSSIGNRRKYIYFFVAVILSVVSALLTSQETRVTPFILYLIIWYKSILSITDNRDFQSRKKLFVISLILYLLLIFIFNITHGDSPTVIKLKTFFPIYVGASLSHFAMLNLESVYNKRKANSINKSQNMKIVTIISNSMVLVFIVSTVTGLFGIWELIFSSNFFKSIEIIFQKIMEVVLYPIIFLTTKLTEFIFKKADMSRLERLNAGKTPEEIEKITNEAISIKSQIIIDKVFLIAKWGIIVLFVYLILYYLFKAIKNKYLTTSVEYLEEEREFILSPIDIRRRIKKPFKELFTGISGLFSKNRSIQNLHSIRQIYIDTILTLRREGYEYETHYTPNEYLSSLKNSKFANTGISDLTKTYNDYRYGGKEPTEEKIENCMRVKRKIYEISRDK